MLNSQWAFVLNITNIFFPSSFSSALKMGSSGQILISGSTNSIWIQFSWLNVCMISCWLITGRIDYGRWGYNVIIKALWFDEGIFLLISSHQTSSHRLALLSLFIIFCWALHYWTICQIICPDYLYPATFHAQQWWVHLE